MSKKKRVETRMTLQLLNITYSTLQLIINLNRITLKYTCNISGMLILIMDYKQHLMPNAFEDFQRKRFRIVSC